MTLILSGRGIHRETVLTLLAFIGYGLIGFTDDYLIAENYMAMGNFSGYPSMTVPMGFEDGCPVGVNLTCRAWEESQMFSIGKAIEDITGYKDLHAEVK